MRDIERRISYETKMQPTEEVKIMTGPLSGAEVESIMRERMLMLQALKHEVSNDLFASLEHKLEYEGRGLERLIQDAATRAETKRSLDRVLKSEYFVQRPLESSIFIV